MLKRKQMGKNIFYFFSYIISGLMGCVLAFIFSLQFLSPVFSQNTSGENNPSLQNIKQKNNKSSDGVLKDIKKMGKELKNLLSDDASSGKNTSKPSQNVSNNNAPPPPQLEGFEKPKSVEISIENNKNKENKRVSQEEPPPIESAEVPPIESPPAEPVEIPPTEPPPAQSAEVPPAEPPPVEEKKEAPISGSLLQLKSYMEPFLYDPTSKRRNPFDDPTQEKLDQEIVGTPGIGKKIKDIVKPPTELYPLKDIELKGIIWDVESPKALFKLPESQGFYTLLQGDRLGKYGVIEEISEDKVKISETIVKGDGIDQQTETRKTIKRINRLKF